MKKKIVKLNRRIEYWQEKFDEKNNKLNRAYAILCAGCKNYSSSMGRKVIACDAIACPIYTRIEGLSQPIIKIEIGIIE